jgi:hypothetical protein
MHVPISPDDPGKIGEDNSISSWPPRDALEWSFGVEISINLFVPSFGFSSE